MGFLVFLIVLVVGIFIIRAIASTPERRRVRELTLEVTTSSDRPYRRTDPKKESQSCWVPPGQSVNVSGFELADGMVYVGKRMTSINGWGSDPALINPKLSVKPRRAGEPMEDLGYWPRYDEIGAKARAGYLNWLAGGRRDPDAPLGFVFLFYYGLERRLLFDAVGMQDARGEIDVLLNELRELLTVYGVSGSFMGYASNLIAYVEAVHKGGPGDPPPLSELAESHQVPIPIKVALGRSVVAGDPIPAELALAWVKTHPDIRLRTAARRCPDEFEQLFLLRYQERTRGGLKLKRNKTNVALEYHTASSGSPSPPRIRMDDIPDVTNLKSPCRKLDALSQEVQDDLAAYSRWVGKTDDRTSAAAVGLLPGEIMLSRLDGESKELSEWLTSVAAESGGVVESSTLLERWPSSTEGKLSKKEAAGMAEFLAALGLGIEPDVRFGRQNPSRVERVVLFQCDEDEEVYASAALESSTLLLQLGVSVAAADGTIDASEEEKLESHLEDAMGLSRSERIRLRARMRLMLACPPNLAGLKRAVEALSEAERHQVARFVLGIAAADGRVEPAEVKTLTRIYKLLGFDAERVHGELHDLASSRRDGPTTVVPQEAADTGYGIPAQPFETVGVTLDKERIATIRAETQEVTGLLRGIFEGDPEPDEESADESPPETPSDTKSTDGAVPGLDEQHSKLVLALGGRVEISRAAFEQLAGELNLMAAGAIEVVNDAAFEACDEPLIEGSDPLEINGYAHQEMVS